MPLSIVAEVAATLVHESTEEPPPKASAAGLAESVQVGTGGGIIERGITSGAIGTMGTTGTRGTTGTTGTPAQQAGPGTKTWAKTCEGVTRPSAKAIDMPIATVNSTVKRPVRIGRLFIHVNTAFIFVILCEISPMPLARRIKERGGVRYKTDHPLTRPPQSEDLRRRTTCVTLPQPDIRHLHAMSTLPILRPH